MSNKEKLDALAKLYDGDRSALATMAAGAAKLKTFVSKWASPMKALAGVLKPFESALSAVEKVFSPMFNVMKPIGEFVGAINSLLNKKLCFLPGKCFKISDIPNAIGKFAKKVTKPLTRKANRLFSKLIDKIIKALPTPPGMDTFDKILDQFASIGKNVTGLVTDLLGSFNVPLVDWVEDVKTMTTNIAAIQ